MDERQPNSLSCDDSAVFPPSPSSQVNGTSNIPLEQDSHSTFQVDGPRKELPVSYPSIAGDIFHHIVPATFGSDHVSLARKLANFTRRSGGFLLVSFHTACLSESGHYHVIHSCTNSVRCRCFEYGFGTVFGRRDFIANESIENFTPEHWRNLYLYLEKGHGYRMLIFFQDTIRSTEKFVLQSWDLPLGSRGRTNEDAVSYEGTTPSLVRETSPSLRTTIAQSSAVGPVRAKKRTRTTAEDLFQASKEVAQLGWALWTTSVPALLRRPEITSKFEDILIMNRKVLEEQSKNAIALCFEQVRDWNFRQFKEELQNRGKKLVFNGEDQCLTWGSPTYLKYMTLQDSADVVIRMMEHNARHLSHLNNNGKNLFVDFVSWFDRQRGKRNTQLLVGEANSCKTWFSKAWLRLAVFVGKISNPTRGETAPFSGAMDARIIFWDEADLGLDQSFSDICKMILGGQEANVNVKYQNRQDVLPAPILMCGNRNPMRFTNKADVDAINSRWHSLHWESTSEIRNLIYGECDPMALFTVLDWACGDLVLADELTTDEMLNIAAEEEANEDADKENVLISIEEAREHMMTAFECYIGNSETSRDLSVVVDELRVHINDIIQKQ
jgi:hypothetical protein